jgi:hypothetical protein
LHSFFDCVVFNGWYDKADAKGFEFGDNVHGVESAVKQSTSICMPRVLAWASNSLTIVAFSLNWLLLWSIYMVNRRPASTMFMLV